MENNIKKIGIMGGTFDPIHYGHLILAEYVVTDQQLDEMIFMPSGTPYLKSEATSGEHRLAMTQLAIDGNKSFSLSTMELNRLGNTYTVDTLEILINQYPDTDFYFVMGADSLFDLHKWRQSSRLFEICHFIVANRGSIHSIEDLEEEIIRLEHKYNARIRMVSIPDIQISSTEIRNRVRDKKSIKYLLPDQVNDYIRANRLYEST